MELLSSTYCFGGEQRQYRHRSAVNNCDMTFSIYLPPGASDNKPMPVVYWLSGLTCSDENFVQKAGAQRYAAELGLIIVAPDTSPRGDDVPDDPEGAWDFGLGAGFYVNASEAPWAQHYNMYDYVSRELPDLIDNHFPTTAKSSICGHSMGGHGALVIALRNSERYSSVSAFAPITHPSVCDWGKKAFSHYLGRDEQCWQQYDACALIKNIGLELPLLVDQGEEDAFLSQQLLTQDLQDTLGEAYPNAVVRMQEGYDHSYFFIASFIGEHLSFHKLHLT